MSGKLSEKDLEQKRHAARKHGVYAVRDRGADALDQQGRSRLQEIKDQLQSRAGVRDMLQERAAHSVMLVELATSYVAGRHKAGIPLDQITLLKSLPAFMNSAHRQIRDLLDVMPDDSKILDLAEHVTRAMGDNGDD